MAKHLKNVITSEIPETYTINPIFYCDVITEY